MNADILRDTAAQIRSGSTLLESVSDVRDEYRRIRRSMEDQLSAIERQIDLDVTLDSSDAGVAKKAMDAVRLTMSATDEALGKL